jgi:AcrR family transcriptional regulator
MSETRDQILAVAATHYLAGGLSGLSMRKIAGEVGVSATAIYRHYDDKLSLVFALVGQAYHRFSAALLRARKEGQPALTSLLALGDAYVDFALKYKGDYQLLFLSTHHLAANAAAGKSDNTFDLPPELQEAGRNALGILIAAVSRGIEEGVIRQGDALELSQMLWAQLHGTVSLHLAQRLGITDAQCKTLCRQGYVATLEGLSPAAKKG